jgi:hypothetical protein
VPKAQAGFRFLTILYIYIYIVFGHTFLLKIYNFTHVPQFLLPDAIRSCVYVNHLQVKVQIESISWKMFTIIQTNIFFHFLEVIELAIWLSQINTMSWVNYLKKRIFRWLLSTYTMLLRFFGNSPSVIQHYWSKYMYINIQCWAVNTLQIQIRIGHKQNKKNIFWLRQDLNLDLKDEQWMY